MKIPHIKRTIRNTKRFTEIVTVLSKFGFRQMIIDSGLNKFLDTGKDELAKEGSWANQPRPLRVRLVLEELGPTFIKLGQILATRPDLVPSEWCQELKKLQDRCTSVEYSAIEEVLQQEFPGRLEHLFQSIDKRPLAAASIAQVHKAILKNGNRVVIKVLRPGNRYLIEEDMALLEAFSQIVEQYFSNLGYSPTAVAKEFSRQLLKEINFINEGQATDRLRKYFEDDPKIYFPKVHWDATTRSVLTLEEVQRQLLSSITPASLSASRRRAVVAAGADAVFKQCLEFGFFHADPHPGNIFLRADDSICFIDCGMTGRLDKKTTEQLINLVTGIIDGNTAKMRRVVLELTDVDPTVTNSREFNIELQYLAGQFQADNLETFDITALLSDFFTVLQRFKIRCPEDLLLLTKALTTIEGVAEEFDPNFDLLGHVRPQLEKIIVNRYSMKALRKRFGNTIISYLELLEDVPSDLHGLLNRIRHNRLTLNLELKRIEHLADKIDLSSRIMGMSMIISALIVGSSILILADRLSQKGSLLGTIGVLGILLAGLGTAGFVISFLLPKRKNKD